MLRHAVAFCAFAGLVLTQTGVSSCGDTGEPGVTWYKDIQPITQANCIACHRDGGIAPFSLETYEQAAPHAAGMAGAVSTGYMPPWPPAEGCQSFKDARVLNDEQIDAINNWASSGAPEGDPADAPDDPPPAAGLAWIDTTVNPGEAYTPTQGDSDEYRCFLLDPGLTAEQHLIGYEVRPGYDPEVHHVLLYATDPLEAQALDDADAGAGYTCYGGPGTSDPAMVGGWVPGMPAVVYPEGSGLRLEQGQILVMQIHYNLANGSGADLTEVDLQYAHEPVQKEGLFALIANSDFSIPANDLNYTDSKSVTLSSNLTVWGLLPHMHQLGKSITVSYKRSGSETCLIDIPDWDFHWQQLYFYTAPVAALKGDVVTVSCTWSNPTDQAVTWGESTSDEMCLSYFYVTP